MAVAVAGFGVMGTHHCCACSHSWTAVNHCGCVCLWAVGGCCGQSSCLSGFVIVHGHGQLLVIIEGGYCGQSSLFVVVEHWWWPGVIFVTFCVC